MNGWKRRKSKMLVYLLNNFYKLNRHRRELDTMPSSAQSWSSPPWIGPSPKPAAHTASPGARRRTSSAVPPSSPTPTPRRVPLHPNLNPPRGWRRSSRHPLFMQRSRFARGLRRVYGHARNRSTLFWQTGNMLRETPAAKRAAGGSEQRPEGTGACVSDSERVSAAGLLPL